MFSEENCSSTRLNAIKRVGVARVRISVAMAEDIEFVAGIIDPDKGHKRTTEEILISCLRWAADQMANSVSFDLTEERDG